MYQNAGEKRHPARGPGRPAAARANRRRGHGTFAKTSPRPPIAGVVGGRWRACSNSEVLDHADGGAELKKWSSSAGNTGRDGGQHRRVEGVQRTSAGRDEAGPQDGGPLGAEVHVGAGRTTGTGCARSHPNTQEGLWTRRRVNFLRRFYGVSKWYLAECQAVFQWGFNLKEVTDEFMRVLLEVSPSTGFPS